MMSNTATFTLHIRNTVKKARDKMGWVLRVFQSRERSLVLTLWNLWNLSPTRVLLPVLESMESKRHASYRSYSMNVYIQNHWSTALKLLRKTALTQIVLSPETPWTLYNYIYLEDNTAYGAKYWWHNGVHNKKHKTSKTWNTVRYSGSNKQKPSTIHSRECKYVFVLLSLLLKKIGNARQGEGDWHPISPKTTAPHYLWRPSASHPSEIYFVLITLVPRLYPSSITYINNIFFWIFAVHLISRTYLLIPVLWKQVLRSYSIGMRKNII